MKKLFLSMLALLLISTASFADGYEIGDNATSFNLLNVDGEYVSLDDFREADGFIVIFTCNHCPYSKLYEDRIIELNEIFSEQGYPVVAINPNDTIKEPEDSYSQMIVRADEKGFEFPYLLDADQSIAKAYGATRTPHVFVLQKSNDGLVVKYIGAIDDNSKSPDDVEEQYVYNAVNNLINEKPIYPNFTKAIGCTIKWAD
jgi:peroxiredoxin